jgi:predicted transposase YdaD
VVNPTAPSSMMPMNKKRTPAMVSALILKLDREDLTFDLIHYVGERSSDHGWVC